MKRWLCAALTLSVSAILFGCTPEPTGKAPPSSSPAETVSPALSREMLPENGTFKTTLNLLCETRETVCRVLGLSEEETEATEKYIVLQNQALFDRDFDIVLWFVSDRLVKFDYALALPTNPDDPADLAGNAEFDRLLKQALDLYGETDPERFVRGRSWMWMTEKDPTGTEFYGDDRYILFCLQYGDLYAVPDAEGKKYITFECEMSGYFDERGSVVY